MHSGPFGLGSEWARASALATGVRKVTASASDNGGLPSSRRCTITSFSVMPSSHSSAMNGTRRPSGSLKESNWSGLTISEIEDERRNITSPSFWKRSRNSVRSVAVSCAGIFRHFSATGAENRRWLAR